MPFSYIGRKEFYSAGKGRKEFYSAGKGRKEFYSAGKGRNAVNFDSESGADVKTVHRAYCFVEGPVLCYHISSHQEDVLKNVNVQTAMKEKVAGGRFLSVALPAAAVLALLIPVKLKLPNAMLLADRFHDGAGWIQIALLAAWAGFLSWKMRDVKAAPFWRNFSWTLFCIVFFLQLVAGLWLDHRFLMTGNLHFPIPGVILAAPLYRGHISFMPILYLAAVLVSGPAWCSHLCYFGGFDSLAAGLNRQKKERRNSAPIPGRNPIRHVALAVIICATLALRALGLPVFWAVAGAAAMGGIGVLLALFFTPRTKKMTNCTLWCPIGTITMYLKHVNPFRMKIDRSGCNGCMLCSSACKYDALSKADVERGRPAMNCTYCGDCLASCGQGSIGYRFFGLSSSSARTLWIGLTVTLHAVTLGLARI